MAIVSFVLVVSGGSKGESLLGGLDSVWDSAGTPHPQRVITGAGIRWAHFLPPIFKALTAVCLLSRLVSLSRASYILRKTSQLHFISVGRVRPPRPRLPPRRVSAPPPLQDRRSLSVGAAEILPLQRGREFREPAVPADLD